MEDQQESLTCVVTGRTLQARPEERVRQACARMLIERLGYRREDLRTEFHVHVGSDTRRIDIAVFPRGTQHAQHTVYGIIECKRPGLSPTDRSNAIGQLRSYESACTNAHFAMFVSTEDGSDAEVYKIVQQGLGYQYMRVPTFPHADAPLETRYTVVGGFPNAAVPAAPRPAPAGQTSSSKLAIGIGAAIVGALVLGGVGAAVALRGSEPAPASTPATFQPAFVPNAPLPVVTVPPNCVVAAEGSFHLRPSETAQSVGREYPSGTRVSVLGPGTTYRNGYLIYRVRVEADGAEGYLFLGPRELAGCPH